MCRLYDELRDGTKVPLDIFSYHYYNGLSDRLASAMPTCHWDPSEASSCVFEKDEYTRTMMKTVITSVIRRKSKKFPETVLGVHQIHKCCNR